MFLGLGIFLVVFLILFVMAVAGAPSGLVIEQNVTALYDEGTFAVNWTVGGADTTHNYTIYIWVGGSLINTSVQNDSATGLSYVNTTEANYSFTIEALNATAVGTNSTTNVSMYVDATGPVVNFTGYTNATFKRSTDNLILNISVGDALSGIANSVCQFDINGTNETVTVSSGWCNITSLNLTGLADGNHTIKVYANDTVNTVGSNESFFVVWIDTTDPTATFSCTPLSVFATETVTCTCTGADASSGVSTTSFTASPSTADTGAATTTCTVTDNAGNSLVSSISYTIGNLKSSGGKVASIIPTTVEEEKKNSWSEISPEKGAVMKDFNKEIGIKQIQINVNNKARNVLITVSKHSGKPAAVSVEKSGEVYRYLQVETINLKDELDKATITIQVEKSWVSGNNLERDEIVLSKFDEIEEKWNELTTTFSDEDSNYYYYDIEISSFSFFAIGEKSVTEEDIVVGEVGEDEEEEKSSSVWIWILIGVLVLIAIKFRVKLKK